MARAGVTYHDVAKAAEVIKNQRQEPTMDRVREQLGTGSKAPSRHCSSVGGQTMGRRPMSVDCQTTLSKW